jgi:hypothetical protein
MCLIFEGAAFSAPFGVDAFGIDLNCAALAFAFYDFGAII